jgi:hypothetical protein
LLRPSCRIPIGFDQLQILARSRFSDFDEHAITIPL